MEHGLVIKGQKYHCPCCGSENVIYDKKEDPKLEEINKKLKNNSSSNNIGCILTTLVLIFIAVGGAGFIVASLIQPILIIVILFVIISRLIKEGKSRDYESEIVSRKKEMENAAIIGIEVTCLDCGKKEYL